MPVKEKTKFKADTEETPEDKNSKLATHLDGAWNDLNIVKVERIEIGTSKGWQVTYRE